MTQEPVLPGPSKRRSFLNGFLATSAGALLVSVLDPVTRFLIPPTAEESSAASVTLDLKAGEVKPNTGRIVKFGKQPAILLRTPAGELRAFSAICTHLACIVQCREDFQHIWCACHNGHYDPASGKNIAGPPPRPLPPYIVSVRGEKIGSWPSSSISSRASPKDIVSYLFGIGPMPARIFLLVSTLGRAPGTWVLSAQGASVAAGEYVELALLTAVTIMVAVPLYHDRHRILDRVRRRASTEDPRC